MGSLDTSPGQMLHLTEAHTTGLQGKVIIVTGGSSGIGLASVKLFAKKGARGIVIVDPRPPPPAEVKGLAFKYIETDISSWYSITDAFQETIDQYGTIDYVFANAGIGECDHLFVTPKDEKTGRPKAPNFAEVDVNLIGALNTVKLAVFWFRELKVKGKIVMTISISGYETPGLPIYTATKHGVLGLLRSAYRDLYDMFGIELNAVCPGPTATNIVSTFAPRGSNLETAGGKSGFQYEEHGPEAVAVAAGYLFSGTFAGRAVAIHGARYRELEAVYDSFRENLLGGELGVPPLSVKGYRALYTCSF